MKIIIKENPALLGQEAAVYCAEVLNRSISDKGKARLVLSTGASQFELLQALVRQSVDFSKVEMFHLDEYIGLPATHPASFRRYLQERFIDIVSPGGVHLVDGEGDVSDTLRRLTEEIRKEPVDLGLIGIGENTHIAFNDPPADFETTEAYKIVELDEACRRQQVREGWFASINEVPAQAISMTVHQIMQCRSIVSFVPYKVKSEAIRRTLACDVPTAEVPASMLKRHTDVRLYLDVDSASQLEQA